MAEKLTFAHSPIHALPSLEDMHAAAWAKVFGVERINPPVTNTLQDQKKKN